MIVGKIEKDYVISKKPSATYGFLTEMEVNDSRVIELEKKEKFATIRLGIYQQAKRDKIKVSTIKEGKGIRVTRTK